MCGVWWIAIEGRWDRFVKFYWPNPRIPKNRPTQYNRESIVLRWSVFWNLGVQSIKFHNFIPSPIDCNPPHPAHITDSATTLSQIYHISPRMQSPKPRTHHRFGHYHITTISHHPSIARVRSLFYVCDDRCSMRIGA